MAPVIDVVKRSGRRPTEKFKREKLHASVYASCLSVRSPEGHAHDTSNAVCDMVVIWLTERPSVTSDDLRRKAGQALDILNPEAAYLYKHHHLVI